MERSWRILGRSWSLLERSWTDLGRLRAILGRSWGLFGPIWGILGRSWGDLRASWGAQGPQDHRNSTPRGAVRARRRWLPSYLLSKLLQHLHLKRGFEEVSEYRLQHAARCCAGGGGSRTRCALRPPPPTGVLLTLRDEVGGMRRLLSCSKLRLPIC